MVEREPTLKDRIQRAHMILEMDAESTAEILLWHEPETIERFFDLVERLISRMPQEFKTDYGENCSPEYYNRFIRGLDDFIVKAYQNGSDAIFMNTTRGLLHNAWMFLKRAQTNIDF